MIDILISAAILVAFTEGLTRLDKAYKRIEATRDDN